MHHRREHAATADPQQLGRELDRDDSDDSDSDIAAAQDIPGAVHEAEQSPPPQYPVSEASSSRPPPFSSLFSSVEDRPGGGKFPAVLVAEGSAAARSIAAPAYGSDSRAPGPFVTDQPATTAARAFQDPVAETKRALPRDTKGESSRKDDDAEPPPAYSEGDSPLFAFSFVMAAAGGASSIITQVQQGGPPINAIGGELPAEPLTQMFVILEETKDRIKSR